MAAKKIITQPDILDLENLGAFMDAQQDPVEDSPSVAVPQETAEDSIQTEATPTDSTEVTKSKAKVKNREASERTRKRITQHDGNDEWGTVLRYAGFYNDNSTAEKTTVAMNADIKTVLEIIHNSYRGEINCGNLIDAICRAFIERNKDKILELAKSSRSLF